MNAGHAENVVGALALAVVDHMHAATTGAAGGHADNAAVALSALGDFLAAPSIDLLGRVLGLTSSGTVRLVDRLAAGGLVRRAVGGDGRVTTVALTPAGRRAARKVRAAREAVLTDALGVLTAAEREQFGRLAGRVLGGIVERKPRDAGRWTCRLCDTAACGREQGDCPAATAAGWQPAVGDVGNAAER